MTDVLTELRNGCAAVAARSRYVHVEAEQIRTYAAALPLDDGAAGEPDPATHVTAGTAEERAAFWLTLDAINFGSGWFPTLRKRPGRSGYFTVAAGIRDRFAARGPWTADALAGIEPSEIAGVLGQDPGHELMALYSHSLRDLGRHVIDEFGQSFHEVIDHAGGSAVKLVDTLAGWECFEDVSTYGGVTLPFLKRAQITAADVDAARIVQFEDLDRLTMFADNLVPHVLRLDGILRFDRSLVERIARGELLEHGSGEEVEIRAGALHAVELIAAERPEARAADIDRILWRRGQAPDYKAQPRHRSRCTAY